MSQSPIIAWEYCELRQEITQGVMHRQYILFYAVGEPSREVSITHRDSAIAQLGVEGWEMVGTVGSFDQNSSGFRIFFKRQIDAAAGDSFGGHDTPNEHDADD